MRYWDASALVPLLVLPVLLSDALLEDRADRL